MKFLAFLLLGNLSHAAFIDIYVDRDRCLDGWISMDVEVRIDEENFRYSPSCGFSFRESFETSKQLRCEVESGMCSGFSPEKKIEVRCDDGSYEEIDIECPLEQA